MCKVLIQYGGLDNFQSLAVQYNPVCVVLHVNLNLHGALETERCEIGMQQKLVVKRNNVPGDGRGWPYHELGQQRQKIIEESAPLLNAIQFLTDAPWESKTAPREGQMICVRGSFDSRWLSVLTTNQRHDAQEHHQHLHQHPCWKSVVCRWC